MWTVFKLHTSSQVYFLNLLLQIEQSPFYLGCKRVLIAQQMLDEILVFCKAYKLAFLDIFCSYSFKSNLIAKKLWPVKKVLMIITKCAKVGFFDCLLIKYFWRNQQENQTKTPLLGSIGSALQMWTILQWTRSSQRLMILSSETMKARWFLRLLILKREVWWPVKHEAKHCHYSKIVPILVLKFTSSSLFQFESFRNQHKNVHTYYYRVFSNIF